MGKAGIARHSVSAFNEKSATRMLSDYLEQKKSIATFFKENDRAPYYDESFELVCEDNAPTKQFIVQIKKVENLKLNNYELCRIKENKQKQNAFHTSIPDAEHQ